MRRRTAPCYFRRNSALSSIIAIILIIAIISALSATIYIILAGFIPDRTDPLAATSFSYEYDADDHMLSFEYISGPTIESTFTLSASSQGLVLSLPMSSAESVSDYLVGTPTFNTYQSMPFYSMEGSSTDYIRIPSNSGINLTTKGSISTWIKPTSISSWMGIIHKGNQKSFNDECYSLQTLQNGRQLFFGIYKTASTYVGAYSDTMLEEDRWYHVVATFDSSSVALYINNQLDDSAENTMGAARTSFGSLQVGVQLTEIYNSHYQNFPFFGEIGPTYLYNRVLSSAEIQALYQGASWEDIRITRNGESIPLEYVSTTATNNTLSPGMSITITHPQFSSGDLINIIYRPTNQILKSISL